MYGYYIPLLLVYTKTEKKPKVKSFQNSAIKNFYYTKVQKAIIVRTELLY